MALHYFFPCPSLFSSIFSPPLILPPSLIPSNDDQTREKGREERKTEIREKGREREKEREKWRENCWKKAVTKSLSLLEKNLDCYFCTWRIWRSLHLFLTHSLLNISLSFSLFFFFRSPPFFSLSLSSHSFALKVKMQSTSSSWTHLNVIYGQEFLLEKVFRSLFLSSYFFEKERERKRGDDFRFLKRIENEEEIECIKTLFLHSHYFFFFWFLFFSSVGSKEMREKRKRGEREKREKF